MKPRRAAAVAAAAALVTGAAWWSQHQAAAHYLPADTASFVAAFQPPPADDSAETRAEVDALLELQRTRSAAQVEAARADREKETSRFFAAIGIDTLHPPDLPLVTALMDRVESDIAPYVRDAKKRFARLRPYEIEPRLAPCIDDVRGDRSYPSGHAAYGYVVAGLLETMVPERAPELRVRAHEYAHQRMVCGVHFRGDLDAGEHAAQLLVELLLRDQAFVRDLRAATTELRTALKLPLLERATSAKAL